ncbi:MAG: hypothetical protein KC897_10740, partial [Candidatus Omnitrophica bacterium]|nr:hypothetical protein [Candidatus Omnitrophota bacterium]
QTPSRFTSTMRSHSSDPIARAVVFLGVMPALALLDLSLAAGLPYPRLKELSRVREVVADYFYGENKFGSSEENLRRYFDWFGVVVRKHT